MRCCATATILLIGFLSALGANCWAAELRVNRNDDPTPDGCTLSDCSLREAVIAANTTVEADVIRLPLGTITLSIAGDNEDDAVSGDLDIHQELTLERNGYRGTIIDGGGIDRVFDIFPSAAAVTLRGFRITNGVVASGSGGAVLDRGSGSLTIERCVVVNNTAGGAGGGLHLQGTTTLIKESGIGNNTAGGAGGGLHLQGTTTLIKRTGIWGNVSGTNGGGLSQVAGSLAIVNSAISRNESGGAGGGLAIETAGTTATLLNVTVAYNSADADNDGRGDSGGIAAFSGASIEISHLVVARNTDLGGEAPDCLTDTEAMLISNGYNLIGDTTGCQVQGPATGDLLDVDPLFSDDWLDLGLGSPAIDAGDPIGCLDENDQPLITDLSGDLRPVDGDGDAIPICDMGALEFDDVPILTDGFESGDTSAWSSTQ